MILLYLTKMRKLYSLYLPSTGYRYKVNNALLRGIKKLNEIQANSGYVAATILESSLTSLPQMHYKQHFSIHEATTYNDVAYRKHRRGKTSQLLIVTLISKIIEWREQGLQRATDEYGSYVPARKATIIQSMRMPITVALKCSQLELTRSVTSKS